jgi:leucyl aminopeptidase
VGAWQAHDGVILPIQLKKWRSGGWPAALELFPDTVVSLISAASKRFEFRPKSGECFSFDASPGQRVVVAVLPRERDSFWWLELARRALQALLDAKAKRIVVELRTTGDGVTRAADAFVSALVAMDYQGPRYPVKPKAGPSKPQPVLSLATTPPSTADVEAAATRAVAVTLGTNRVRSLAAAAGNDLTPTRYVAIASEMAREKGLGTDFFPRARLAEMKAGAFLAVAQGSEDPGVGILKVTYRPENAALRVAVVGKGITFDTGGNNIKTGGHMYGMNGDMAGSAVALSIVLHAISVRWPVAIDAYLAITDNVLSPRSYRPNDVVTSLRGKTIEVVDTDAEGRMVLADTLYLASQDRPDLMLDFATLTGACVRALGTTVSGAYTNRRRWFGRILGAGRRSGERVFPFPNDRDYGRCLKSDIADIKQCRASGGVDHIEAGHFLSRFVPASVPWVHVDLSAIENDEGLAHVPTKNTGFGVRFGVTFIEEFLEDLRRGRIRRSPSS